MTPSPEPQSKRSARARTDGTLDGNLRDANASGNGHLARAGDGLSMPKAGKARVHGAESGREESPASYGRVLASEGLSDLLKGIDQATHGGQCFELTRESLRRHLSIHLRVSGACSVREGLELIRAVTIEVEAALHQAHQGQLPRARLKADTPQAHCVMLLKLAAQSLDAEQWVLELEQGLAAPLDSVRSARKQQSGIPGEQREALVLFHALATAWQNAAELHLNQCPTEVREPVEQALTALKDGLTNRDEDTNWAALCLELEGLGKALAAYRGTSVKSVGQVLPKKEREMLLGKVHVLQKMVARVAAGYLKDELDSAINPGLRDQLRFSRHVASSLYGALVNSTTLTSGDRFSRDLLAARQHPGLLAEPRLTEVLAALHFVLTVLGPELSRRRGGDEG